VLGVRNDEPEMNYPALICWVLIAWSVTAKPSTLLILSLASIPFASLALLPPDIVGMSILPQSMLALILVIKIIVPQLPLSPRLLNALRLRNLGFLAIFLLVGAVATAVMPRLLAEEIVIVPMRENWTTGLLTVTMQNFTQFGYVSLSVVTVFAVALMAYEQWFAQTLLVGILVGCLICILTGLIDLAAASAGMESWLKPFRNADYAFLTSVEVAGAKRVVGLTPEASAYGPICVNFATAIVLLRNLYAEGTQRILATGIAIGVVVMAVLSTSSTAFLGLALLGVVYVGNWARRAVFSSELGQSGLIGELLVGLGLSAAVLYILIARANLFDPLVNIVQEVIFNKPLTDSYYQRSEWSSVAWQTVSSTWGLGVGFGSTRTSNWFAAIVSNAGLIGATCMAIFLLQTFARQPSARSAFSNELVTGLKLSLIPALAMAGVNSAGPDFGLWVAVALGAVAGVAESNPQRGSSLNTPFISGSIAARPEFMNRNMRSVRLPYWRQRTGAPAPKRGP
jgi:hypothetical protein